MKKILAALGTLLIFVGVKGQTAPVKKNTTPQDSFSNVITTNNTSVKLVKSNTASNNTVKGTTVKLTQKISPESKAAPVKASPTIKR